MRFGSLGAFLGFKLIQKEWKILNSTWALSGPRLKGAGSQTKMAQRPINSMTQHAVTARRARAWCHARRR
jgi:hypothetical protein